MHTPVAIKVVIAVALLLAINELAPGVPETILVLVAIYLVLERPEVGRLLTAALASFDDKLRPAAATASSGGRSAGGHW